MASRFYETGLGVLVAILILVGTTANNADAALVSMDTAFGANTGTRDTDTGLVWLDVTLSTTFSYDVLLVELDGGAFPGFHLATQNQVLTLWQNAGINVGDLNVFTSANFMPIVDLMALVSVTGLNTGNLGGGNFFDFTAGHIESGPGGGGSVTLAALSADPDPTMTGRVSFSGVPSNNVNSEHGAWLVTPLPAAFWLFASALVALAGMVYRRGMKVAPASS